MKRPGRRPRGRASRDDILASARALFSSNGWEGTSIRAIARGADVDPGVVVVGHAAVRRARSVRTTPAARRTTATTFQVTS